MGQGGQVVLVNGTPYTWDLENDSCNQMEWQFQRDARTVPPYSARKVYVETRAGLLKRYDSSGSASYRLRGTESVFEIQARWLNLSAFFKGMQTKNASAGSTIAMGLISNRPSYFVLSGQDGDYNSVGNVEHWMQQNLYRLGGRTLQQVCVPSSHDSGMSKVTFKTKFASIGTVATQYVSVESQLRYGVRYFDIRPTLYKDEWSCGHWSFIDPKPWVRFLPFNSWQGGNGESIKEVIEGVNSFTASSNELVILSLYRAFAVRDTDDAFRRDDFADLQEHQWRSLLDILTGEAGLKHLWRPTEGDGELEVKDLTTIPLQRFIGGPEAAVIIILDANFDVTKYPGCFPQSAWQWDCSDWQKRENERLQEFQQQAAKQNGRPYSYSGCHTQTDDEAIASTLGQSSSSVLELAVDAKDKLFTELFPACSEKVHPCAMNMDAIDSSDLAALAMAMNDRSSK